MDENPLVKETPEQRNDLTSSGTKVWAVVGQVAVILGILVACITIWTYFFSPSPRLYARYEEAHRLIPVNLFKDLQTNITKNFLVEYSKSLSKEKKDGFEKNNGFALRDLFNYSEDIVENNKKSFSEIQYIRQKIKVSVYNTGQKEAQSINIELPRTVKGFYQIDYSDGDPKPFERIIQITNIRPESVAYVDIWLSNDVVQAKNITVNFPDGIVPVEEPFNESRGWSDSVLITVLASSNLLFIIIIFVVAFKSLNVNQEQSKSA